MAHRFAISKPERRFSSRKSEVTPCIWCGRAGSTSITYGTVLENIRAGGIFGEMALIDDGPRSAAAMAAEPTEVVAIDKPAFLSVVRDDPQFALRVMSLLATRLRRMNKQI